MPRNQPRQLVGTSAGRADHQACLSGCNFLTALLKPANRFSSATGQTDTILKTSCQPLGDQFNEFLRKFHLSSRRAPQSLRQLRVL